MLEIVAILSRATHYHLNFTHVDDVYNKQTQTKSFVVFEMLKSANNMILNNCSINGKV